VNHDDSLVVTITVTCYSWAPSRGDHLFTCGAIVWLPQYIGTLHWLVPYCWLLICTLTFICLSAEYLLQKAFKGTMLLKVHTSWYKTNLFPLSVFGQITILIDVQNHQWTRKSFFRTRVIKHDYEFLTSIISCFITSITNCFQPRNVWP